MLLGHIQLLNKYCVKSSCLYYCDNKAPNSKAYFHTIFYWVYI
ncbi:hypothetical protein P842_00465 [Enterobacter roggenkampii UCI 39]|uniref:Uncharacterized protein n=2 Tax=Enterobacter cloacae complex TaxID=354276 RepID=A0ABD7KHE1_9ENTR|nr:hypothetical protein L423_01316 [Enterobacter roggenkampii]ESM33119.1 hypothetical protein L402_02764 [Enterobacter asburiae]EUL64644.1 hypothetical protein P842_00465 [Enterobacter roggenkampii UCI 39]SAA58139.1 Uncharacterised protein [Enterobacter cloacae]SAA13126.1 Uncharacterised protein [Enterobacter roggenkampii]